MGLKSMLVNSGNVGGNWKVANNLLNGNQKLIERY